MLDMVAGSVQDGRWLVTLTLMSVGGFEEVWMKLVFGRFELEEPVRLSRHICCFHVTVESLRSSTFSNLELETANAILANVTPQTAVCSSPAA